MFQHTAARRRLDQTGRRHIQKIESFNTQPPEGGWWQSCSGLRRFRGFNTQPPEGGWAETLQALNTMIVSTHSRPKAAG